MSKDATIDLASTGGARGGNLTLTEALHSCNPAVAATARAIADHQNTPGALLPILHQVQDALGYIPQECVGLIGENLQRSRAEVHGVITFYPHFRTTPPSSHVVAVCRAEACQARGADALIAHAQQRLRCGFHEMDIETDTALEPVYCLGLCAQGPAVEIDGQIHAHVTPERFDDLLAQAQSNDATENA